MSDTMTIQLDRRGLVTLPKTLRDAYHLKAGDDLTLLDLGGVFILSPRHSQVDRLADDVREAVCDGGESLENILTALREARESHKESV